MQRRRLAQVLITFGVLIVVAGSALHLGAAYPKVSAALAASKLDRGLADALRSVFLVVGTAWIAIAGVALLAAFVVTRASRALVLFCGFALLIEIPIWVGAMGWFVGNEMFLAAALLIVFGGLLFGQTGEAQPVSSKASR